MIYKLIEKLYPNEGYSIMRLNKGLTNKNYILCIHSQKYVVRIPYPHQHFINRKQEETVSKLVASLDCDTIYFNADNGVKISKYIEYAQDYKTCIDDDKIERCAALMRQLHQLPCVEFEFDCIQQLHNYQSHVSNPIFDLSAFHDAINHIQNKKYIPTLCHNDFVYGNILYTPTKDYLIDYEYAANNDPLFDVISFLGENQIFNFQLRDRFYKAYFQQSEVPYEELEIMERFQNVLWCYWAMMMFELHNEKIYKDIAQDKYNALTNQ